MAQRILKTQLKMVWSKWSAFSVGGRDWPTAFCSVYAMLCFYDEITYKFSVEPIHKLLISLALQGAAYGKPQTAAILACISVNICVHILSS